MQRLLLLAILFFSLPLSASSLEVRMTLLQQLEMLDELEFSENIEAANLCISARNFTCARENILSAEYISTTTEHDLVLVSTWQSYQNEQAKIRQEDKERREQRLAARKRQEQLRRDKEQRKKEKWLEIKRQQQIELNKPKQSAAAMAIAALDQINTNVKTTTAENQRHFQQEMKRSTAQFERNQKARQQAEQQQLRQSQARKEQHALQQQRLAQQKAQARQIQQEQAKPKEKYQLVIEALAFCWKSTTKEDHWRCRGPSHIKGSRNNATSLFQPGLLAQASNAGCSGANNNFRQAWSTGDKSGYVMHCQKALKESDADVASDYNIPAYIRTKRKIYKCNYPIQNGCSIYMQGSGDVANRRIIE